MRGTIEVPATAGQGMKELVEEIARTLVSEPDAVLVDEKEGNVLELRVDPKDLGRVIGKQGRTARSLRAVVNAAAAKRNRHYTLEIIE